MDPVNAVSSALPGSVLTGLGGLTNDPFAATTSGTPSAPGTAGSGADFSTLLTNAIGGLTGLQQNADTAVAGVASGQGTDIHQAMIAMQQASIGMQLAVQVRDKTVEAYQSLMNMQV